MTIRHAPLEAGQRRLSAAAAAAWLPHTCFKHGPPGRVGVELELLVRVAGEPARPTDGREFDRWRAAAVAVPVRGRVTIEPGGQLELSGAPADDLATCLAVTSADLARLRELAAGYGLELVGAGTDAREVRRRVRPEARYSAMEAYLDRWGPAGRVMMRRTASVQVNLEAAAPGAPGPAAPGRGGPDGSGGRWRLLHAVGPVLVAAFANSPGGPGPWAGWASSRLGAWLALDPARTGEPVVAPGDSVATAWARYCLDAPVMLVRRPGTDWSAPPGLTFREWIDRREHAVPGHPGPTIDDLAHHLTTLFPPVRPRGHLEVRYLDAQPGDWWRVPVSVLWALAVDPSARREALAASAPHHGRWLTAARRGLRDDGLARAAVDVLEAAHAGLLRTPAGVGAAAGVAAYLDRWTRTRRCPGDDLAHPGDLGAGGTPRPRSLTTRSEEGHPC